MSDTMPVSADDILYDRDGHLAHQWRRLMGALAAKKFWEGVRLIAGPSGENPMTLDAVPDPIIGHLGEIQPDGSAELILTDEGRRLYGENTRVIVTNAAEPAADTPTIVEGR